MSEQAKQDARVVVDGRRIGIRSGDTLGIGIVMAVADSAQIAERFAACADMMRGIPMELIQTFASPDDPHIRLAMLAGALEGHEQSDPSPSAMRAAKAVADAVHDMEQDRWYEGDALVVNCNELACIISRETGCDALAKELLHLVRLLEPLERNGGLDVPGLATLNGPRAALSLYTGK